MSVIVRSVPTMGAANWCDDCGTPNPVNFRKSAYGDVTSLCSPCHLRRRDGVIAAIRQAPTQIGAVVA